MLGRLADELDQIAGVEDADDVIEGFFINRDARMTALGDGFLHLLKTGADLDGEDVGPRGHDLAGLDIVESDDALDHVALVLVHDAFLFPFLNDGEDFVFDVLLHLLRLGRLITGRGAGDEIFRRVHQLGGWSEDLAQEVQGPNDAGDDRFGCMSGQRVGNSDRDHKRYTAGNDHRQEVLKPEGVFQPLEQVNHCDQQEDVGDEADQRRDEDQVVLVVEGGIEIVLLAPAFELFVEPGRERSRMQ